MRQRLLRGERHAFEDVLERARRAEHAQQSLAAAAARYHADEHLDLAHAQVLGVGGVAEVAGERDLQPAAESGPLIAAR